MTPERKTSNALRHTIQDKDTLITYRSCQRWGLESRVRVSALIVKNTWFHGVMVSTLDSESSDPSSSLGGT